MTFLMNHGEKLKYVSKSASADVKTPLMLTKYLFCLYDALNNVLFVY